MKAVNIKTFGPMDYQNGPDWNEMDWKRPEWTRMDKPTKGTKPTRLGYRYHDWLIMGRVPPGDQ